MLKQISEFNDKYETGVIAWMVGIHLGALAALPYFSWGMFGLIWFIYFITGCLGITLGFHRLLTHRAFKVPRWLERFFATCGTLAVQGGPMHWVAHHRMHHAGSDTPADPHDATRGFWFSHMLWFNFKREQFDCKERQKKFARDIYADPYYRFLETRTAQLGFQVIMAAILYALGGWVWVGWGIFVRLVLVYHCTWLVNSAAHIWGYKNYEVGDSARNNPLVALLTWGEGWHNNHHAHADVAPAGHKFWEVDITYMVIRCLAFFGLAKDIKTLESKRRAEKLTVTVVPPPVGLRKDFASTQT